MRENSKTEKKNTRKFDSNCESKKNKENDDDDDEEEEKNPAVDK